MFSSEPLQLQVYLSPVIFYYSRMFYLDIKTKYSLTCWQVHYFWPVTSDTYSMYEAMWHDITNQIGGDTISVTIPVMFGRYIHCRKHLCTSENKLD
jgi:hypothetical protein